MTERRPSIPNRRASEAKDEIGRVRRRYKTDLSRRTKLLPAEVPHVEDMVVVMKLAGYSRVQMGKAIGISRGQVREILDKPEVTEKIVSLRKRLPSAALDLLQGFMLEAIMAIVDVMRSSGDDGIVLKAAGEVLDRAGVPKASRQERLQVNEERTVITDDGLVDKLREAPVEVQEEAAQIIERLEVLLGETAKADDDVAD